VLSWKWSLLWIRILIEDDLWQILSIYIKKDIPRDTFFLVQCVQWKNSKRSLQKERYNVIGMFPNTVPHYNLQPTPLRIHTDLSQYDETVPTNCFNSFSTQPTFLLFIKPKLRKYAWQWFATDL